MNRKALLCALCACAMLNVGAQESINLAGKWNFTIDRENTATPPALVVSVCPQHSIVTPDSGLPVP